MNTNAVYPGGRGKYGPKVNWDTFPDAASMQPWIPQYESMSQKEAGRSRTWTDNMRSVMQRRTVRRRERSDKKLSCIIGVTTSSLRKASCFCSPLGLSTECSSTRPAGQILEKLPSWGKLILITYSTFSCSGLCREEIIVSFMMTCAKVEVLLHKFSLMNH